MGAYIRKKNEGVKKGSERAGKNKLERKGRSERVKLGRGEALCFFCTHFTTTKFTIEKEIKKVVNKNLAISSSYFCISALPFHFFPARKCLFRILGISFGWCESVVN